MLVSHTFVSQIVCLGECHVEQPWTLWQPGNTDWRVRRLRFVPPFLLAQIALAIGVQVLVRVLVATGGDWRCLFPDS